MQRAKIRVYNSIIPLLINRLPLVSIHRVLYIGRRHRSMTNRSGKCKLGRGVGLRSNCGRANQLEER